MCFRENIISFELAVNIYELPLHILHHLLEVACETLALHRYTTYHMVLLKLAS
jgi:hypothetical protein